MSFRFASAAGGLAFVCALAVAAPTTGDGAYTEAQAERGRLVYEASCLSCHDLEFYETNLAVWQGASVGELFVALSATMPSENPGGLADEEYLDVLAYIFSITGSPGGDEELSLLNVDAIEIVYPVSERVSAPVQ